MALGHNHHINELTAHIIMCPGHRYQMTELAVTCPLVFRVRQSSELQEGNGGRGHSPRWKCRGRGEGCEEEEEEEKSEDSDGGGGWGGEQGER